MLKTVFWWVRVRKLDWPEIAEALRNPPRLLCLIVALLCPFGVGLGVKFWIERSFALAYPHVPPAGASTPLLNVLAFGTLCLGIWGFQAFKRYQAWGREEKS